MWGERGQGGEGRQKTGTEAARPPTQESESTTRQEPAQGGKAPETKGKGPGDRGKGGGPGRRTRGRHQGHGRQGEEQSTEGPPTHPPTQKTPARRREEPAVRANRPDGRPGGHGGPAHRHPGSPTWRRRGGVVGQASEAFHGGGPASASPTPHRDGPVPRGARCFPLRPATGPRSVQDQTCRGAMQFAGGGRYRARTLNSWRSRLLSASHSERLRDGACFAWQEPR